ncbi:MAG TPA: bifunctional DNA primase/polymerase [Actinomycetota bacterium]|nr:bifunctional DNA primase/polymerase [Actinomycetota bacterium]
MSAAGESLREAALDYARAGWAVFPLFGIRANGECGCRRADCPRPGKHPLVARGLHEATTEVGVVAGWWGRWPAANIAVATGAASGIVVIDVDEPGGSASLELVMRALGPLPATLEALTGGGGRHLVYVHPGGWMGNTVGKLHGFADPLPHVDLRADGGAIVVAPSRHVSGRTYRWVDATTPPAPAPNWLREAPRPAPVPIPAVSMGPGGNTGYGLAALRRELQELSATEHGENSRLNQAAFSLGMLVAGGELDRSTVEEQLTQAGLGIGLHPAEIARTIASGLGRGAQLPRVAPHRLRRP